MKFSRRSSSNIIRGIVIGLLLLCFLPFFPKAIASFTSREQQDKQIPPDRPPITDFNQSR